MPSSPHDLQVVILSRTYWIVYGSPLTSSPYGDNPGNAAHFKILNSQPLAE